MTALALKQIVSDALAEVGANVAWMRLPKGKPRTTTWLGIEHGFGIRHYATDRNVYKTESWGYRLENANPCRAVRLNRKRKCERFLSRAELERLGEVLARMRASDDAVRPIAAAHVRQPRRDE